MRSIPYQYYPSLPIAPLGAAHICDHYLERYYLDMVTDNTELGKLQEHLLRCGSCSDKTEETKVYVDAMRVAAILHAGAFVKHLRLN